MFIRPLKLAYYVKNLPLYSDDKSLSTGKIAFDDVWNRCTEFADVQSYILWVYRYVYESNPYIRQ